MLQGKSSAQRSRQLVERPDLQGGLGGSSLLHTPVRTLLRHLLHVHVDSPEGGFVEAIELDLGGCMAMIIA